jgi:hypothetical protein
MSDLTYYECGPRGGYEGMEGVMHTVTYTYNIRITYYRHRREGREFIIGRKGRGGGSYIQYMG